VEENPVRGAVRLAPHPLDERLGVLTIDRPPVNALSQPMWDRLAAVAEELHEDSPYRALVIAGAGEHFSVGADVKELVGLDVEAFDRRNRVLQGAFHAIACAPQITVAALHGHVLGGGCELALAADFRVAGYGAKLGLPEITLGIMPGSGGTQRLAHVVGPQEARRLLLTGKTLSASEALRIGLVDQVVADDRVVEQAVDRALRFSRGPLALRQVKRALQASIDLPIEEGLALEADLITSCFASEDGRRGLRGFATKTLGSVRFRGR
jgi:enoyl-CoA hydratase/carnithine racemase